MVSSRKKKEGDEKTGRTVIKGSRFGLGEGSEWTDGKGALKGDLREPSEPGEEPGQAC